MNQEIQRRTTKRGDILEAEDWVGPILRFIGYWGQECGHFDAAGLVYYGQMREALETAVNVALYLETSKPAERRMYSTRQLGAILGMSHVAVMKRAARGEEWVNAQTSNVIRKIDMRRKRAQQLETLGIADAREQLRATGTDNVRPFPQR